MVDAPWRSAGLLLLSPQAFPASHTSAARSIMVSLGKGEAIRHWALRLRSLALLVHTIVFGRFFCGILTAPSHLRRCALSARRCYPAQAAPECRVPDKVERCHRLLKYCYACGPQGSLSWCGTSARLPWTAFRAPYETSLTGAWGSQAVSSSRADGAHASQRSACCSNCPLGATLLAQPSSQGQSPSQSPMTSLAASAAKDCLPCASIRRRSVDGKCISVAGAWPGPGALTAVPPCSVPRRPLRLRFAMLRPEPCARAVPTATARLGPPPSLARLSHAEGRRPCLVLLGLLWLGAPSTCPLRLSSRRLMAGVRPP